MTNQLKIKTYFKPAIALLFSLSLLISCGGGGGGGSSSSSSTTTPSSPTFAITTIDSAGDVGWYSSIATGSVHIAYYDVTNKNLNYAFNDGISWGTPVTIDGDATNDLGSDTSIAIDSNDYAHITYFDNNGGHGNLKYIHYTGTSWSTPMILDGDDNDTVGWNSSIILDASNRIYISYYDATNKNLKYIYYNGTSWSLPVTLDASDDVGEYSSIALDSSNNPHIAYYDYNNGYSKLKYIFYDGASWSTPVTVDGNDADEVGSYCSIALDSSDRVHISYYDSTVDKGNLKYAFHNGSQWVVTTLDGTESDYVGLNTSIAIDSADNVHIAYFDFSNFDLKYATSASGSWVITTVDSSGDVGEFSSIAIGSDGKIHISYYDNSNGNLKYAVK